MVIVSAAILLRKEEGHCPLLSGSAQNPVNFSSVESVHGTHATGRTYRTTPDCFHWDTSSAWSIGNPKTEKTKTSLTVASSSITQLVIAASKKNSADSLILIGISQEQSNIDLYKAHPLPSSSVQPDRAIVVAWMMVAKIHKMRIKANAISSGIWSLPKFRKE